MERICRNKANQIFYCTESVLYDIWLVQLQGSDPQTRFQQIKSTQSVHVEIRNELGVQQIKKKERNPSDVRWFDVICEKEESRFFFFLMKFCWIPPRHISFSLHTCSHLGCSQRLRATARRVKVLTMHRQTSLLRLILENEMSAGSPRR